MTSEPLQSQRGTDLHILVVGYGSIGRRHVRNVLALGYKRLSVYRSGQSGRANVSTEVPVDTYYKLDDALAQHPDVVIIANPTSLHVPVALAAAENGCHLFIEKPLSDSLDGTDTLLSSVEQNNTIATVGYNLRFHPIISKLRELIEAEAVGKVLSIRAWAGQYLPDWHPGEDYRNGYMARRELGGGVILTLSHELDYLISLFGNVAAVSAVAARCPNLEMSTEGLAEIILEFEGGLVGQVHLDCIRRTPSRGCEFIGTHGTIWCDLLRGSIQIFRPDRAAAEVVDMALPNSNDMYVEEISDFLNCVQTNRPARVSIGEGISTLKVAMAAQRASLTGTRQKCV